MRIGIDCRTIVNPGFGEAGGVGYYAYYLVKHLLKLDRANEYVLFFDNRVVETAEFERKGVLIKFFPYANYGAYLPYAYSQMLIAAFLQREKLDVYHSPANVIPSYYKGPSVQTIHDLSLFLYPQWYPSRWRSRATLSRKALFPSSVRRASCVIALSEELKHDAERLFKIPSSRISVIPEGYDANGHHAEHNHPSCEDVSRKYLIEQKFLLSVGTIEMRKNLSGLIQAFFRVLQDGKVETRGLQLIIAGKAGNGLGSMRKEIERVNRELGMEAVKYLGYILHEEKVCLLKHALGFVSTSLYEGFPLLALEAMGLGCPVLVSDIPSYAEVVGDSGLTCKANDVASATDGIRRLLEGGGREAMIAKGKQRAAQFSWEGSARQTFEAYRSVTAC